MRWALPTMHRLLPRGPRQTSGMESMSNGAIICNEPVFWSKEWWLLIVCFVFNCGVSVKGGEFRALIKRVEKRRALALPFV